MSVVRPVSDPATARMEPLAGVSWSFQQKPPVTRRIERLEPGSGVRLRPRKEVDERSRYPTSDGKPLAETGTHLEVIFAVWYALRTVSEQQPRTFVGSNQLVYYEQGNPKRCFAPDCYVMVDTDMTRPPNILTWVDGVPACIIEVTSKKTRRKDIYDKRALYQAIGVREYVLFDPLEDYLKPSLEVNRLENGQYVRQEGDLEGHFALRVLPVELYREGCWLRVRNSVTGERLPMPEDLQRQAQTAEQEGRQARLRARQERQRAEEAIKVAELERAKADQERAKAELERSKAQQADIRAEEALQKAELERIRAERAEAQLQELQRRLALLGAPHQNQD